MTHRFLQVDAFTVRPFEGNACAVILGADDLEPDTMQRVAREMNLSETAFVVSSTRADIGARYFTPAEEIPLAGHPTVATLHALIEEGLLELGSDAGASRAVTLELPAGVIPVEMTRTLTGVRVAMSQLAPEFTDIHDPALVGPAFGLEPSDFHPDVPIQTVSTGTPQLMMAVRGHEQLRRARLDADLYLALKREAGFFSPHLFTVRGATERGRTFARHFGSPPDTTEDPFTGSATGGMAAFLWRYGLIDQPAFIAEQGHWMGRPGSAIVEVVGPPQAIETVRVAGEAVTVLRGELVV